jgi:hypothetical protein
MGGIPVRGKEAAVDNFGRGINSIPDFISQSGRNSSRQLGKPVRRQNPGVDGGEICPKLSRLRNSHHEGHCPPGRTIPDGVLRSPEPVPSSAGPYLAINRRIATYNAAIYPV